MEVVKLLPSRLINPLIHVKLTDEQVEKGRNAEEAFKHRYSKHIITEQQRIEYILECCNMHFLVTGYADFIMLRNKKLYIVEVKSYTIVSRKRLTNYGKIAALQALLYALPLNADIMLAYMNWNGELRTYIISEEEKQKLLIYLMYALKQYIEVLKQANKLEEFTIEISDAEYQSMKVISL